MHPERAGQTHPGEPRLPAAVAVIAAIVLYAALPNQLLIGPRYVVPGLELILFVPLMLANPRRMSRQKPASSGWMVWACWRVPGVAGRCLLLEGSSLRELSHAVR